MIHKRGKWAVNKPTTKNYGHGVSNGYGLKSKFSEPSHVNRLNELKKKYLDVATNNRKYI